ncbi:MAG: glycosyltransferase [Caldilinea sp.]|nr:glycosyltransferase [Caldilinea sp.]
MTMSSLRELAALRVAFVHDWLNQMGGAENVLEELVQLFPGAPVYTSMYDRYAMPAAYQQWDIRTTFMQRLPGVTRHHQKYLPVYPLAFARTDLSAYDLVLSNKSGFCHGVRTASRERKAVHVCYCLTPTRYLWLFDQYREREQIHPALGALLQPMLAQLRRWDYAAAQRVDHFIAISSEVQRRIRDIYHRESVIIHPPVDTEYFQPAQKPSIGDYYLIVSRLIPYKRIDLAVRAFIHLPEEKLIVVGDGRDLAQLAATAPPNVSFIGRQPRQRVRELLQHCKAFLFPGLEDFGIAPVEALSAGRPVIAFAGGGALDTVTPGVTGELFAEQTVESLLATLQLFDAHAYDPVACRVQAERFSVAAFRQKLLAYLEWVLLQPAATNLPGTSARP